MITHHTMIHGKCPINGLWDYYVLDVCTESFIKCEDIEAACDQVRGANWTQEKIAEKLRESLPEDCQITLEGRHGQNITTRIIA